MADVSDMSAGVSNPMFGDEGSMYDASPKSADSRLDDNILVARLVARIAELEEKLYARDLQDTSEIENSSTALNQLGRLFSNVTNGSWGSAKPAPLAVLPEDTKAEREANVLAKQIAATAIIETAGKLRVAKEANEDLLKKLQDVEAVDCQLRAELQDRISVLDTQVTSSEGEVQRLRIELDETKARCEAMQEAAAAGARLMADLETVRGHLAGSQAELKSCRELWLNEREARRKLHDQLQELRGNIRVLCRVRPVLGPEPEPAVVDVPQEGEVVVRARDRRPMPFEFNVALGAASTQEQVFAEVEHLIMSCIYGRNVCVFAYGQTGSGKTYTMEGTDEAPGIYLRAMALLFKLLDGVAADAEADGTSGEGAGTQLEVSMMEVYNDDVRDLLANGGGAAAAKPLAVSGMGPGELPAGAERVPGLRWRPVGGLEDVREALRVGHAARATAATALNSSSSRSHALFSVRIHRSDPHLGHVVSTLSLVDLAGSERVAKSEAKGAVLKEAQHINRSLSALGDVISALQQRSPHIPYRNSKITQVLQDSLSPLSKVLMVCCLSPDESCATETLSSLNFASRANSVELAAGAAAAAPARTRQRSRPGDARRS